MFLKCDVFFFEYRQVGGFFDRILKPHATSKVGLTTNYCTLAYFRTYFCRAQGCTSSIYLNETKASLLHLLSYFWGNWKVADKKNSEKHTSDVFEVRRFPVF